MFSFLNQGNYRGGEILALDTECRRESALSDTPHHRSVCLWVAMGSQIFEASTHIHVAAGLRLVCQLVLALNFKMPVFRKKFIALEVANPLTDFDADFSADFLDDIPSRIGVSQSGPKISMKLSLLTFSTLTPGDVQLVITN